MCSYLTKGHRITDGQLLHGRADVVGVLLRLELRRVHSDDHELVGGILSVQVVHVRDRADAVAAPEGPEVEEDHPPPQLREAQRLGIDPAFDAGELWRELR
jgi:hypothetical protein